MVPHTSGAVPLLVWLFLCRCIEPRVYTHRFWRNACRIIISRFIIWLSYSIFNYLACFNLSGNKILQHNGSIHCALVTVYTYRCHTTRLHSCTYSNFTSGSSICDVFIYAQHRYMHTQMRTIIFQEISCSITLLHIMPQLKSISNCLLSTNVSPKWQKNCWNSILLAYLTSLSYTWLIEIYPFVISDYYWVLKGCLHWRIAPKCTVWSQFHSWPQGMCVLFVNAVKGF